jgi:hypothetical protein
MTRRGVVHTIDALFAAAILTTALLYASQIPRDRDYTHTKPLAVLGMQTLLKIDCNGTLGRLVHAQSWDKLENVMRVMLPTGVSFNVTIFDDQGNFVNEEVISNGGLHGRTIESVEYSLVVEKGSCPLYRIRIQVGV